MNRLSQAKILHSKQPIIKGKVMKTCEEVMTTDPVCCLPTDSVKRAAELMKRENVGPIPVIENEQTRKLVGIITDRDLVLKVIAEGCDASSTQVESVMTRKVVSCRADDPLQKAMNLMSEHQLRRITIVDKANVILGIISQADIATRGDRPEMTAEVVKDISQT
jgi:CBS domain-containing protein